MTDQIRGGRRILTRRAVLMAGLGVAPLSRLVSAEAQAPWRSFEVDVRVDVLDARGPVVVWLPLALSRFVPYQRAIAQTWTGNTQAVDLRGDPASGAPILIANWAAGVSGPTLTLTIRVATRDHRVSLSEGAVRSTRGERLEFYLRPTLLIPTDGIVRETARKIIRGHVSELSRAQAIYDWVVDNTFRDPEVKGCGLGDIRSMLESGLLGGKCADLNALFVGLCRAARLPARDLYGIRIAQSDTFKNLGRSGDVTTAQHCRAEVYVDRRGWIPADPADVRKVALEEEAGATPDAAHVRRARAQLFGSWEMNWMAFNDAHDVALPGSKGKALPFFMYPQAEVDGIRRDSLDPSTFRYRITSREVG